MIQHVRLAHTRNGPVSLLHAVHRCDVCGYAAGTKRAVQVSKYTVVMLSAVSLLHNKVFKNLISVS